MVHQYPRLTTTYYSNSPLFPSSASTLLVVVGAADDARPTEDFLQLASGALSHLLLGATYTIAASLVRDSSPTLVCRPYGA